MDSFSTSSIQQTDRQTIHDSGQGAGRAYANSRPPPTRAARSGRSPVDTLMTPFARKKFATSRELSCKATVRLCDIRRVGRNLTQKARTKPA